MNNLILYLIFFIIGIFSINFINEANTKASEFSKIGDMLGFKY